MLNKDSVKIQEIQDMGHRNTICEAVLNVRDALEIAYPYSTFFIVASDRHLDKNGVPQRYEVAAKKGKCREITIETTEISTTTPWLADTCTEVALNVIVSHQPQDITAMAAAELHDAALDYARYMGKSIDGFDYCRDHPKWRDRLNPATVSDGSAADPTIHRIGQKVTPLALEQHITQVRQELHRLESMRDPSTLHRMINDEIKRLKRKNELQQAKLLQADLDAYEAEQQRKRLIHEERLKSLAKAREMLAKKRLAKKNQQPNFAKMAKAKRQQLAARKAEKKKKKAAGASASQVSSCSQLLSR